jgi:hypothetical protein
MEQALFKHQEDKKRQDAKPKQEEEQRKEVEVEKRKTAEAAVMVAPVVSPMNQIDLDKADPSINDHLADMM